VVSTLLVAGGVATAIVFGTQSSSNQSLSGPLGTYPVSSFK
jgi:hypothetical protein